MMSGLPSEDEDAEVSSASQFVPGPDARQALSYA
jgi:hypothetical protein